MNEDINTLRRILRQSKTLAVVGLSANWWRPSYFAAKYMQEHGYTVIPVNPRYPEIAGRTCYPSIAALPEKVRVPRETTPFVQRCRFTPATRSCLTMRG